MSPKCPQVGTACHDTMGRGGTTWRATAACHPQGITSGTPPRSPSCQAPCGAGGQGSCGAPVPNTVTVPVRETKARLLTAGEEQHSALLSPASKRVYSSCINLGAREEEEGRGTEGLIFPIEG